MLTEISRLESRGSSLVNENRIAEALADFHAALALAESIGNLELQASILTRIGSAQMFRGDHGNAATSLEKAVELFQKVKKPAEEAEAWARLAQIYTALGSYDSAATALEKSRTLANTQDSAQAEAIAEMLGAMEKMAAHGPSTAFLYSFDKKLDLLAGGRLLFDQFWPLLGDIATIAADLRRSSSTRRRQTAS